MTKINIVGAGMSGLLAANILRRHEIIVLEKQEQLPNNHNAVLRFRTPNVGEVLGIPFRKVNMIKTYVPWQNIVADSMSYSRKCTGKYLSDRSIITGTLINERYIAPLNLIEQMSNNVHIKYSIDFASLDNLQDIPPSSEPIISTIPMPILMDILDYKYDHSNFVYFPGSVLTATVRNCDAFISVLFPGPHNYSRATITGDRLMIEFPNRKKIDLINFGLHDICSNLGIFASDIINIQAKKQEFFKIIEINESERKKFMRWATIHHNIYSLGRYACWRPKLLLDDLVDDLHKIEGWITGGERR